MNQRYDDGMAVRRKVLGDAHVDRANANKSDFDAPYTMRKMRPRLARLRLEYIRITMPLFDDQPTEGVKVIR